MEEILERFVAISEEPYTWLTEWKRTHKKKLVAVYPMHVPEEIIHASGAMPFIMQRSTELIAPSYLPSFFCDFSRSTLDLLLKGRLDFVDGIVRSNTCYVVQGLDHIEGIKRPDLFQCSIFLPVPYYKPSAQAMVLDQLQQFRTRLEEFVGCVTSEEALWRSVEVYNESRALIRKLYALRRARPGIIRAREMQAIIKSNMIMPKEEHTQLLAELLPQIERRNTSNNTKVKLLVSGSMCEDVLLEVLDFFEDLGGTIVDDDLYMGYRYVAVDCRPAASPIESLAQRYLDLVPDPTRFHPEKDWGDYLVNKVKEAQAQGAVLLLVKHCEPHWLSYINLKGKLEAAGIPHFYIESEQESLSMGKLRTKFEAFIEMIKGGS